MGSELRVLKHFTSAAKPSTPIAVVVDPDASGTTATSEGMQGQIRMNLFRGVKDHGQNQIDLLTDEIEQLEQKLKERYRERLFTQRMVDVMNQFYSGQAEPTV